MSIKPIDHNVMIPKTHELSAEKHVQNTKNKNIVESNFITQEKIINKNKKKVMDSNKTNKSKVNDDNNRQKGQKSNLNKERKEKEEPEKKIRHIKNIGSNIDIRI